MTDMERIPVVIGLLLGMLVGVSIGKAFGEPLLGVALLAGAGLFAGRLAGDAVQQLADSES